MRFLRLPRRAYQLALAARTHALAGLDDESIAARLRTEFPRAGELAPHALRVWEQSTNPAINTARKALTRLTTDESPAPGR